MLVPCVAVTGKLYEALAVAAPIVATAVKMPSLAISSGAAPLSSIAFVAEPPIRVRSTFIVVPESRSLVAQRNGVAVRRTD